MIPVVNPATREVLAHVPDMRAEDADAIVRRAAAGTSWRKRTLLERIEVIDQFLHLLQKDFEDLVLLLTRETGKPIVDAEYEVKYAKEVFRVFKEAAPTALMGVASPLDAQFEKTSDYYLSRREPLGVVLAILPFNDPGELFAFKVAPALITGNCVVVKPSREAPLTAMRLTHLLHEAGVPADALQCVTGMGGGLGDALVAHSSVDCVSFTGSTATGMHVYQSAAAHLARVILELGGNDALIVFPDADLELAVEMTAAGRIDFAGQSCCANKRMILHHEIAAEFTERLLEALAARFPLGDPTERSTKLGPLISSAAVERVARAVTHTVEQGARLALGGQRVDETFYEATVLTGVTPQMDVACDLEIFGPVFPLIVADSDEEALRIANQTSYGLNAAVFTRDIDRAFQFATQLECGLVVINGNPLYRPFIHGHGGIKLTGSGREGLRTSMEQMTTEKGIAFRNVLRRSSE